MLSFGLLLLYLPGFSAAALVWPAEWLLVLLWTLLGVVLWWRHRHESEDAK